MACHNYRKFYCQSVLVSTSCCNKITEQVTYKKKKRNALLTVLEAKVQDQGARMVRWGPSFRSETSCVLTWWKRLEASFTSHKSHYKGHLQDLSTSQSPHLLISSPLGIRISTCKFSPYEHPDHCTIFPVSCPGT